MCAYKCVHTRSHVVTRYRSAMMMMCVCSFCLFCNLEGIRIHLSISSLSFLGCCERSRCLDGEPLSHHHSEYAPTRQVPSDVLVVSIHPTTRAIQSFQRKLEIHPPHLNQSCFNHLLGIPPNSTRIHCSQSHYRVDSYRAVEMVLDSTFKRITILGT